ncbi:MAG: LysM peptidoglycan-binding domain-containing protein [Flavobacteriales bacterium]|nr:LysM peptidoglycan-binding domain-containing protein [Flavobacteriales bacterium]
MKFSNLILFIAIFFNFQFSIESCMAQSDSLEIHQINGKNYYIHVVAPGNTLYSIHKKYNVPLDVIEKENPSVANGLSLGEKIFIPVKKDAEQEFQSINGNYFLHKVEKGRTLYSLAKEFNLQQKDIVALNPEIDENGVQEGQMIKIPVREIKQNKPSEVSNLPVNYKTHFVKSGETLYSLSKLYQVSIDSIKIVNNGLVDGLKVDQNIFIPIKETRIAVANLNQSTLNHIVDTIKQVAQLQFNGQKKTVYKVALLLSFYLKENEEMTYNALEKRKIYPRSTFAVEFYQGVLLALDSLSNEETKFELYVYDTEGQDSLQTMKVLAKPELKTMDLIVGPLYASNFEKAAEFASKHNIPIVSPVKQSNKVLLGNETVFKVIPSRSSSVNQLVKLVVDSFNTDNLIAIQYQNNTESALVDAYVKEYNAAVLKRNDTSRYSPMKKVVVTKSEEVVSHLKINANNVIFLPSTNSTFITNLFIALTAKLNTKEYKNCTITLIGLEEWLQFDNIDIEYFQTLNVHIPINQFVDYDDEFTKSVVSGYYQKTETYPTNNSLLGYDVASYFCSNLLKYGKVYVGNTSDVKTISGQFNFFKTGVESGYENVYTRVVKFDNYSLKIVY